jgi:hypothetical protein
MIKYKSDPDELRAMGIISDDIYYFMKMREAWGDYGEQKRLMKLQYLESKKRNKQKKQEQLSEKEIKEIAEKEIAKQIENIFKNI